MISLDFSKSKLRIQSLEKYKDEIERIDKKLERMSKDESENAGWVFYPENISLANIRQIKSYAKEVQKKAQVLLVIGIGGSYLGIKAILDIFAKSHLAKDDRFPEIIYAGNNMSTKYMQDTIDYLTDKDFCINVISKSGTTLEPSIAFRVFEKLLVEKYGIEESVNRVFVTTNTKSGTMLEIANTKGYKTLEIPENIGGRFSVLTPVGLFPFAVAGLDIQALLDGAKNASFEYLDEDILKNSCYQYALLRYLLYSQHGKKQEFVVCYEPSFDSFLQWIRQLFNESEGKMNRGIYTNTAIYTTDLHSVGQIIQEGERTIFETTINVGRENQQDIQIYNEQDNIDGLNYLAGKTLNYINKASMYATIDAHLSGDVPCILITIDDVTEYEIGGLIYFFEKAIAIYCMLLGVQPFNQPGVESYKRNMYKLLGKYDD